MIQLIVCDIEGCIMPPRRGVVELAALLPLAGYCALARTNPELPPLVFCTGRQMPYAECVAQMVGAFFPSFPSVVENGAFLYDIAGNEVWRHPSLDAASLAVLGEVRGACETLVEQWGAVKEPGKEICLSLNPPGDLAIEEFFVVVQKELAPWSNHLTLTHSQSAVDITPQGIDKAAGIHFLAQRTGIAPQDMLGIGDTRGDLPMLQLVGQPCGPANVTEEVRATGAYISNQEGPNGVMEILQRFVPGIA